MDIQTLQNLPAFTVAILGVYMMARYFSNAFSKHADANRENTRITNETIRNNINVSNEFYKSVVSYMDRLDKGVHRDMGNINDNVNHVQRTVSQGNEASIRLVEAVQKLTEQIYNREGELVGAIDRLKLSNDVNHNDIIKTLVDGREIILRGVKEQLDLTSENQALVLAEIKDILNPLKDEFNDFNMGNKEMRNYLKKIISVLDHVKPVADTAHTAKE